MKICGIICELNPAHNGHKYIFDKAREITGADYIVAILSGDYVQRGEPALTDKHLRTRMALSLGADAVFELPGIFATGSAQYFARGSISLLHNLHADYVFFGSESGSLSDLENNECTTPNNILGREYINAITYFNSPLIPMTLPRIGTDYNDINSVSENIASASYIRRQIEENKTRELSGLIPKEIYSLLTDYSRESSFIFYEDFGSILFSRLLLGQNQGYSKYFDVYEDFSAKIKKNLNGFTTADEFCHLLKSREIAFSHIKRGLLHILLDYTKEDESYIKNENYLAYIRLLGFKKESLPLLSAIKAFCPYPIISKQADAARLINGKALGLFEKDIQASNLYSFISSKKHGKSRVINEITRPVIIL